MKHRDMYRNVPPFIKGPGLHQVDAHPVVHDDGTLKKPNRPYQHFLVQDTSNGSPNTTITPVTVEERDGRFVCSAYSIYAHQPASSYDISKPVEDIEPRDFNHLPVLLFPGDRLEHIGGLETVTLSEREFRQ